MDTLLPAFIGLPGGPELLVILLLVVLLFGANKLPKLARSSGQAMGEFKRGREQIESELTEAARDSAAPAEPEPAERA
jgi:sec-independent protein translocase protein TatA